MISYTRIVPHHPRIRRSSRSVRTQVALILISAWLISPCTATAGTLTVVGDMGVVWNGGPSPELTLGLANTTTIDEAVSGFQLRLHIIADASASGQLLFDTAGMPASNYIFVGNSLNEPEFTGPPSPTIDDYWDLHALFFMGGGTDIDAGQSRNLITLTFNDALAPQGLFFVAISPFNSDHADSSYYSPLPDGTATSFANLPAGNGEIVVASIFVGAQQSQPVPEPHAALAAIIGAALVWVCRRRAGCSQSF